MSGVRLVPLSAEHVARLDALAQDPDVQRNTYVPSPPPSDFGTTWLEGYERGRADGTREGFAIVDAEDGSFLGIAVAVRIDEEANEAELGYILAPEARGRGAATEALRQLTESGFARGFQRLGCAGTRTTWPREKSRSAAATRSREFSVRLLQGRAPQRHVHLLATTGRRLVRVSRRASASSRKSRCAA